MSYLAKAQDLYQMINTGQLLDAFEKYYHPEVVMVEATGHAREGKATCRGYEEQFLGSIQEFHGAGVLGITANEDEKTTMVESWMEVTFKDGNRVKLEQVAVQRWEGDHITHERFYYNPGPQA
ncbi:MAG: nuclear transport factor 2 family protein [Microscillaceae bacterium]